MPCHAVRVRGCGQYCPQNLIIWHCYHARHKYNITVLLTIASAVASPSSSRPPLPVTLQDSSGTSHTHLPYHHVYCIVPITRGLNAGYSTYMRQASDLHVVSLFSQFMAVKCDLNLGLLLHSLDVQTGSAWVSNCCVMGECQTFNV